MTNELMKEIEKEIGSRFLEIYNEKLGCRFTIDHIGESPDIGCVDNRTGERLYLEIAVHQNLEGDAKKEFERIRGERESLGLSMGMRGNIDNILGNLGVLLEKKLQASYSGTPTALVIARITTIWSPNDWRIFATQFARDIFQGREHNYPKGVWIFWEGSETRKGEILNLLQIR
jgi:hypothetical protein